MEIYASGGTFKITDGTTVSVEITYDSNNLEATRANLADSGLDLVLDANGSPVAGTDVDGNLHIPGVYAPVQEYYENPNDGNELYFRKMWSLHTLKAPDARFEYDIQNDSECPSDAEHLFPDDIEDVDPPIDQACNFPDRTTLQYFHSQELDGHPSVLISEQKNFSGISLFEPLSNGDLLLRHGRIFENSVVGPLDVDDIVVAEDEHGGLLAAIIVKGLREIDSADLYLLGEVHEYVSLIPTTNLAYSIENSVNEMVLAIDTTGDLWLSGGLYQFHELFSPTQDRGTPADVE